MMALQRQHSASSWQQMATILLCLSLRPSAVTAQQEAIPLTDSNIKSAVNFYLHPSNNDLEQVAQAYGGSIETWDTSAVTDLSEVFAEAIDFTYDLSQWDVSSVTSLRAAFYNTQNFGANISTWDTSNVQDMRVLMAYSTNFSSDISNWNTESVELLRAAFAGYSATAVTTDNVNDNVQVGRNPTTEGTLPIAFWRTNSLTDVEGLFAGTQFFEADLTYWDMSKVTNMAFLFEETVNFYGGDIASWDTSNVQDMRYMFHGSVNMRNARDIATQWDTSSVTTMERIFFNATNTLDDGTAPLDTDLFYLCWDVESLNTSLSDAGTLEEAFCNSNAGGFNCACLPEDLVDKVNSGCNNTIKTCFNSLSSAENIGNGEEDGTAANDVEGENLVQETSGALSSRHAFLPLLAAGIVSLLSKALS